ncbi:hypothetical protein IE53DRAFT_366646 [Violaceomyces palustris]|uniref:Uncharacterized protein n=1 Tax=Violaceomyces palustris TaxID=1673888 RepID=A0ACD0P4V2_9BASI|nr:hypothetical protein IE53DRAFT_366646 [Violaceomyces palustris]
MFSSLFQPCEMKLHLLQNAVFLHPPNYPLPSEHDRPPQANDEIVRGLVELYVPTHRHIAGIRVRLRAIQTIAILDPTLGPTPMSWEDSIVMEKVVEIGINQPEFPSLRSQRRQQQQSSATSTDTDNSRGRTQAVGPSVSGMHSSSSHGLRSSSPGGSLPASMARAMSRGRALASNMGKATTVLSHSPSPSSSRQGSRAPSPSERGRPIQRATPPSIPGTPTFTDDETDTEANQSRPSRRRIWTPSISRSNSRAPSKNRRARSPDDRPSAAAPVSREDPPPFTETPESEVENVLDSALAAHARRALSIEPSGRRAVGNSSQRSMSTVDTSRRTGSTSGGGILTNGSNGGSGSARSGNRSSSVGWPHDIHFFGSRKGARSKSRAAEDKGKRPASKRRDISSVDENDPETSWEVEKPEEHGIELQKGVHGFEFAFILPCDAPPYERSTYGKVRWIIKATAIGAGRAKSNVECWRDLFPMVNPSPDGGPTPLTVLYNDLHPTVGLVSISCTSNNISVGGVFNIDINSPAPPEDLIVYLVRVSLETTIELHTKRKGKQVVPTQRHKMFEKGWVPPKNPDSGHGDGKRNEGFIRSAGNDHAWTVQGIARIPDDNVIRASTLAGSKASIRMSHTLVVEIVHSRDPSLPAPDEKEREKDKESRDRRLKVFALRQPILIPSCCCAYDAVTLPAYSAEDSSSRPVNMPYDIGISHIGEPGAPTTLPPNAPWANTGIQIHGPSHAFCVCGMSLADLSEQERNLIPTQPLSSLDTDLFRHHGKIGEIPLQRTRSPSVASSMNSGGVNGGSVGGGSRGRRRSSASSSNNRRLSFVGSNGSTKTKSRSPSSNRNPSVDASGSGFGNVTRTASRSSRMSNRSNTSLGGGGGGSNLLGSPPAYQQEGNVENPIGSTLSSVVENGGGNGSSP